MKIQINLSILFILIFGFFSCDKESSPTITKEYNLSTITRVSIQGVCDANIYYGTAQNVELVGSEHLFEKTEVSVNGTTLIIKVNIGLFGNSDLVANITIPRIESVETFRSGDVEISDFSGLGDLNLSVSGSGSIRSGYLDLGQNRITTDISGSGDVEVNGSAESSDISITGSGDYDGFGMLVNSSTIYISGSGNVEVNALNDLNVTITGSGNVIYRGFPNLNTSITGSGTVTN